jgi:hypothetical protein
MARTALVLFFVARQGLRPDAHGLLAGRKQRLLLPFIAHAVGHLGLALRSLSGGVLLLRIGCRHCGHGLAAGTGRLAVLARATAVDGARCALPALLRVVRANGVCTICSLGQSASAEAGHP